MVQNREDLKDHIERILFRIRVSHYNPDNLEQISKLFDSELAELNKKCNATTGLNKVQFEKKIIEAMRVYWDYIKSFKDSTYEPYKKIYQTKSGELHEKVKSEITQLKRDFNEATGESKIGFGDSLVNAYLLYLDLASELEQKTSPEYRSIYKEVIDSLESIKTNIS